ncbi:unnamed protein product, partial [Mesorhabditis belari]|uniref:HECT-type E3 ubiquitin transferase n=1 Tax=Mesorhabditis belari TaxID=2138241 RepID=A0AAF3F1V8_9BILA
MSSVPCVVDDLMGSKVTRVAAGRCHTIAVVKGRVYTFGLNSSGQLGNGTSQKQLTPSSLENCDQVTAIFTGWDHTFIVRTAGLLDLHPGHSAILRYPMLLSKARIADYLSRREKMDLIGDLEVAFSSLSLLNGSFLYEDERRYKIDEKNHGVNLDDVMDAMNLLGQSSDSKQFSELIVDGCKESFFGKDFYPKTFISDECLRGFLILPWLNSFVSNLNKDVIERLHIPLSKAFKQLQPAQQDTLEKWWKLVPVRHFNRIVSGLVAAVSKSLERNPDITRNLPLLEVLTRLNKLNSSINKIPFESFYVDILSEKVDLKMDYCRWTAYNQQGRSGEHFWSDFPFILNGPAKGDLLHVDASLRQQVMVSNSYVNLFGHQVLVQNPMFHYRVRRKHIVEDTVTILPQVPLETLQKPLRVEFAGEEGEDGGGIRKEYFMLLFQQILQPEYGMFNEDSESHLVWFSGNTSESHEFKMVGTLTALAVYNNVLVDFPFPLALYKLLLKQKVGLDDFCELHPTEGKGLQSLLDYEEDNMEDVFDLMFSITHLVYGHPTEIELKPGGKDIPVNQQNKQEYVELYVKSRLEGGVNGEIGKQFEYFRQGFTAVMKSRLVNLFQPRELMELVSGSENYDWTEFREIVQYDGVYHASHPAILAFWEAFQELNQEERKKFLQFLSGTTRLPVKGMKELKVKFQPSSPTALPVAHTCANILDLPNINNKTEMLRRLRISLEHTSGFTLV